ncbi:MAG: hypothetical protein HPY90_05655 [Syntrophothermus sp.]|uniref:hypothetical protein n=1 Tax=Syntrophothermus sp. TaxID=2736299 RepID=UPI00258055BA|nr:hypothetical protein [Syntrophothermus sp.]NSW82750.1 hypothetical protein [Syntrophothermus sp.]
MVKSLKTFLDKLNPEYPITNRQAKIIAFMILLCLPMPIMLLWLAIIVLHWRYDQEMNINYYMILSIICYMLLAALNIAPGYPVTVDDIEYFNPIWYPQYLYDLYQNFSWDYWQEQVLKHMKGLNDVLGTMGFVLLVVMILFKWDAKKEIKEIERENMKKLMRAKEEEFWRRVRGGRSR